MWKKIKSGLSAAPAKSGYADAGDMLRVLCTFFVGWFHIWQQSWLNPNFEILGQKIRMYPVVACGYIFVDLLLLLSGFLLMLGFLSGRSRRIKPFYIGRLTRILPSYLFCVLLIFFAWSLPTGAYASGSHMLTDLFSHLSFTHTFFYNSYYATRINGALWTLAIEMQFYLIFPLLARAFERKPGITFSAMMIAGIGFRLAVWRCADDAAMYFNQLPAFLDVYACGMLSAMIYHKICRGKRPQRSWNAWLCTLLAIASIAVIYRLADLQLAQSGTANVRIGQMKYRLPLALAGCMFIVCGSRAIRLVRWLFSNRFVRWLSTLSFNFYIWHQFLAVRLKAWRIPGYTGDSPHKEGQMPWQWQYTLACFLGALLISALITYLIERPVTRLVRRYTGRKAKKA